MGFRKSKKFLLQKLRMQDLKGLYIVVQIIWVEFGLMNMLKMCGLQAM